MSSQTPAEIDVSRGVDDALSYTTSETSISTNATERNRAGAGRGLGQIYDSLGERLEKLVNKQGKRRGWKGDWERYRVRNASEVSRNATAPNLIGPGRVLDGVLTIAGDKLEVRMNELAEKMGLGPEAIHSRIYDQFTKGCGPGAYGLTRTTSGGQRVFITMQRMMQESVFIDDCRRLLRYAQSDIPVNQVTALSALASLAISDPYLRQFLVELGAFTAIASLRPRLSQYPIAERDVLQTASRRALLSFSELECNSIAKDIHDLAMIKAGSTEAVEILIESKTMDLVRMLDVRNSEISYLTMHHLAILLPRRKRRFELPTENTDSTLELVGGKLVASAARDFDTLDWASVDELVRNCLFHNDNYLWRRSTHNELISNGRLDAWAIVLGFAFRWPELMPRTAAHVLYMVDEDYRFLHFGSDWVAPAHSPLFQLALKYVSSDAPAPQSFSEILPEEVNFPGTSQLASRFEARVRESISSSSDKALADALLERRLPHGVSQMVVTEQFVPHGDTFSNACNTLVKLALQAINKSEKLHARQNLAYLCIVDRYCKRAVHVALDSAQKESASDRATLRRVEKILKFVAKPKNKIAAKDKLLEEQAILDTKMFVLFRHLIPKAPYPGGKNEIHLRSFAPFGRQFMCMICLMSGDLTLLDPGAPVPKCHALRISLRDVLWLEVPEDETFLVDETFHTYVLAGTFEVGGTGSGRTSTGVEKNYVAVAIDPTGIPQWCTVQDGDAEVWYYDTASMRVKASRFFVMVLRYDPVDTSIRHFTSKSKSNLPKGATDVSGTLFWEPFEEKTTVDEFGLDVKGGLGLYGF